MADAGFDACRTFPARGSPASSEPLRQNLPSGLSMRATLRDPRDSIVRKSGDHLRRSVTFSLPDPYRPNAITHAPLQCAEPVGIAVVVAHEIPASVQSDQ